MTDTSTERGVRLPLTPLTTHAAWSTGSLDHIMRCRPATADDIAVASERTSVLWPCSWWSTALVNEPSASWRSLSPVALSVSPAYWSWRRNCSTLSALTVCPSASMGPVTSSSCRRPATSNEITPFTGWPVSLVHMAAASGAFTSNCGVHPRLRMSNVGLSHPQFRSKSPVALTAPTGSVRSPEGPISPTCTDPADVVATPTSRKVPDPARISALLAASTT